MNTLSVSNVEKQKVEMGQSPSLNHKFIWEETYKN